MRYRRPLPRSQDEQKRPRLASALKCVSRMTVYWVLLLAQRRPSARLTAACGLIGLAAAPADGAGRGRPGSAPKVPSPASCGER